MMPINSSIRLKLATSFLLMGTVIMIVVSIAAYVQTYNALMDQVEKQGAAITRTFSQLTAAHIFKSDFAAVLENANEIVTTGNLKSVTLIDPRGVVWVTTRLDRADKEPLNPFYRSVISTQTLNYRKQQSADEDFLSLSVRSLPWAMWFTCW